MPFNFARAPFSNERLPRLVFTLAVIAVAAITVVHGMFLTRYLLREQEELDIRVEELRQSVREAEAATEHERQALSRDETTLATEKTQFLTRMYRQKSFSWTGLFNELEAITPPSARITSILPVEEDNRIAVTMTVVGRTLQDVLELVRQLEQSSLFATVYPLDEANLDVRRGGEPGIAATLQLDYVEPAARHEPEVQPEPELETETETNAEPDVTEPETETDTETETEIPRQPGSSSGVEP